MGVPWVWNLTTVTLEVQAPASVSSGLGLGHPNKRNKWGPRVGGRLTAPGIQPSVRHHLFAPVCTCCD